MKEQTIAPFLIYGDAMSQNMTEDELKYSRFTIRGALVLFILFVGIFVVLYGCKVYGWYFAELSAVFMIMGILSAIAMGWGPNIIGKKFVAGFTDVAMLFMQTLLNFLIPSGSGQAATSMPIMAPWPTCWASHGTPPSWPISSATACPTSSGPPPAPTSWPVWPASSWRSGGSSSFPLSCVSLRPRPF